MYGWGSPLPPSKFKLSSIFLVPYHDTSPNTHTPAPVITRLRNNANAGLEKRCKKKDMV